MSTSCRQDGEAPTVRIHPADIAAIAAAVVELLPEQSASEGDQFIDAATLAGALGVDRSWVYAHAGQLGAVRLGEGTRARLRFPRDRAVAALNAHSVGVVETSPTQTSRRRARRAAPGLTRAGSPLLPVPDEKA